MQNSYRNKAIWPLFLSILDKCWPQTLHVIPSGLTPLSRLFLKWFIDVNRSPSRRLFVVFKSVWNEKSQIMIWRAHSFIDVNGYWISNSQGLAHLTRPATRGHNKSTVYYRFIWVGIKHAKDKLFYFSKFSTTVSWILCTKHNHSRSSQIQLKSSYWPA